MFLILKNKHLWWFYYCNKTSFTSSFISCWIYVHCDDVRHTSTSQGFIYAVFSELCSTSLAATYRIYQLACTSPSYWKHILSWLYTNGLWWCTCKWFLQCKFFFLFGTFSNSLPLCVCGTFSKYFYVMCGGFGWNTFDAKRCYQTRSCWGKKVWVREAGTKLATGDS